MDPADIVDPADAALCQLLIHMAEQTLDPRRREKLLDLMLTVPPIAEWPQEAVDQWRTTYEHIRNLHRDLQQQELERMFEAVGDESN